MPGGFKWVGSLSDDPQGKVKTYQVASTHATLLAVGDLVGITGESDTNGKPYVDAATAGAAATGVIVAIDPNYTTENFTAIGLPASTAGSVKVNTDPRALYEVDVANGPLVAANVGLNGNVLATAATLYGGLAVSNMQFNATGIDTTATLNFRIEELRVGDDGVLGSKALVMLNNSTALAGAAGV